MSLSVRHAQPGDAGGLRRVATAAWWDTYPGLLGLATIEAFIDAAYSIERLNRRIGGETFLVVEEAGSIIAFADAVVEADRLNLTAIYTLPARRREGAGTLLLRTLLERFPGLPVTADVLAGNRKGETFYERLGFVARERIAVELFGEAAVERRWWLGATLER